MGNESCATCRHCKKLEKWDYCEKGVEHTVMFGYACTVFAAREGIVIWMVGADEHTGMCECYQKQEVDNG